MWINFVFKSNLGEEFKDNCYQNTKWCIKGCYNIDASFFLDFAKSFSAKMKRKGHDLLDP